MQKITLLQTDLWLLPDRAVYVADLKLLLVSDVHLGKSETFQQAGIPISSQVNHSNLDRLLRLEKQVRPEQIWILGDLFHARNAISEALRQIWQAFVEQIDATVHLILGNHDRPLISLLESFGIHSHTHPVEMGCLVLSHEPSLQEGDRLNLCGHVHPCLRLRNALDDLRLPCFYLDRRQNLLILPSFGEFTGGYEVTPTADTVIYAIADHSIISFEGIPRDRQKPAFRRSRNAG